MALMDIPPNTSSTPEAASVRIRYWPARTGWAWIGRGLNLYMHQPLGLLSVVALGPLLSLTLVLIPTLGQMLALTLFPFFLAGMLQGARRAALGLPPRIAVYLDGVRDPVGRMRLLQLGVLYALLVGTLGWIWTLLTGDIPPPTPSAVLPAPSATATAPADTVSLWDLALSLGLVLVTVPVQVGVLLATALISFYQMPTPKAVFAAVIAAWTNKWAILLSLLGISGLTLLSLMSLGALVDVLGLSVETVQKLAIPFVLALMPIGVASSLIMLSDIFTAEPGTPPPGPV